MSFRDFFGSRIHTSYNKLLYIHVALQSPTIPHAHYYEAAIVPHATDATGRALLGLLAVLLALLAVHAPGKLVCSRELCIRHIYIVLVALVVYAAHIACCLRHT